jgi:LuxR family transcriptional regulator, activator of conjugal transfer of Ti plasmids
VSGHEIIFQDFTDALWTANCESALRGIADRLATKLGFRWFAYLGLTEGRELLISSYPRSWTDRYFEKRYDRVDPIVTISRQQSQLFSWSGSKPEIVRSSVQRTFFREAQEFNIKAGFTIPLRSGFGRFTALTFATDEKDIEVEKTLSSARDIIQLAGLYFHARVELVFKDIKQAGTGALLSQRESQCLAWAARGKTMVEIGEILALTPRTIAFHLENARSKLGASNLTQTVAIAVRERLIPF